MITLEQVADALSEIRAVHIDARRCLPCRSPRVRCTACADVCPERAISLGRVPAVRECSGCGLCTAVCQADALRLDDPSDPELLQRFARLARTATCLQLTCAGHGQAAAPRGQDGAAQGQAGSPHSRAGADRAAHLQLTCLGRLTPELLLAAAACGFAEVRLLQPATCPHCDRAAGMDRLRRAVTKVQTVLDHVGTQCDMRLQHPAEHKPVPAAAARTRTAQRRLDPPVHAERRAFLLSALGLLRQALPAAPRNEGPDPFAHSPSRRREILLWALQRLTLPSRTPQDDVVWDDAALHLTGPCHRCGVCARLCPNGALSLDEGGLSLAPQQCHTCGLCTQVCPVRALSLGEPRPISHLLRADPVPLGSPRPTRCTACGAEVLVVLPAGEPHAAPSHAPATPPSTPHGAPGAASSGTPGGTPAHTLCLSCAMRRISPGTTEVMRP